MKPTISDERKTTYYAGMALSVLGGLIFFSVFISVALQMVNPTGMMISGFFASFAIRGVLGMGLMIVGQMLMKVGARGLAGSGVVLDPQRTRTDLEPWTRAAGGMLGDALDESGIDLKSSGEGDELSFDEKLRRLESLRNEGLLTEAEYQTKRKEMIDQKW